MSDPEKSQKNQMTDVELLSSFGFEQYDGNTSFSAAKVIAIADTNHGGDHSIYANLLKHVVSPEDCVLVEGLDITTNIDRLNLQNAGKVDSWEDPTLYALVRLLVSRKSLLEEKIGMLLLPTFLSRQEASRSIENGWEEPSVRLAGALASLMTVYERLAIDARNKVMLRMALTRLPTITGREFIIAGVSHLREDPKYPDRTNVCRRLDQVGVPSAALRPIKELPFTRTSVGAHFSYLKYIDRTEFKSMWLQSPASPD